MFTAVTAAEWGRYGIRSNCVAVGLVASPRAVAAWEVAGIDPDAVAAGVPLGRAGTPEEVAPHPVPRQRRAVVRERPDVLGGRRPADEQRERRLNRASASGALVVQELPQACSTWTRSAWSAIT